jgi:hypothetical protein
VAARVLVYRVLAKGHATWGENTFVRFAEVGASHARAGARVLADGLPGVYREAAVIVYVELWVLGIDDGDEPEEDWAKFRKSDEDRRRTYGR